MGVGSIAERFVIVFTLSDVGSGLKVFFFCADITEVC